MLIELREPTTTQLTRLSKAQAVTREQIDLAFDLVKVKFKNLDDEQFFGMVASVAQTLATNYLAEVINSNSSR